MTEANEASVMCVVIHVTISTFCAHTQMADSVAEQVPLLPVAGHAATSAAAAATAPVAVPSCVFFDRANVLKYRMCE
jgi:hypothetical protein